MKNIFKQIVIKVLHLQSRLVLLRFKPKIIAVVGSVGKTSTKDAIYTALKDSLHIRKNQKSFGSEIGVPLTILGFNNAWNNYFLWGWYMIRGIFVVFSFSYPKWLVIEAGIDRPGDMDVLGKILRPDIVVLTRFPDVPAHVEFFSSPEEVNNEDKKILNYIKYNGSIIFNADDSFITKVAKDKSLEVLKIIGYGNSNESVVKFSNEQILYTSSDNNSLPSGMSFKINYENNSIPLSIDGALGVQHIYPISAAIATGLSLGIPILNMVNSLKNHKAPRGRMNIIKGIKESVIIDDTYNSSPEAMNKAIYTLDSLNIKGKKIAVVGDMLEIGKFTSIEHKKIGQIIAKSSIDYLFTVGARSADTGVGAEEAGMSEENIFKFNNHKDASDKIKEKITTGSVVLVKGSQGSRMEKVVKNIMNNPEDSELILVRQDKEWHNR